MPSFSISAGVRPKSFGCVTAGRVFSGNAAGQPPRPEIHGSISLPFGVVTFTERFGGVEVTPAIYRAMVEEAEAALAPFEREHRIRHQIAARRVQMVGSSGTVTTLAGIHLALPRYIRALVDGSTLTFAQIDRVSRHLAGLDLAGRAASPCVGRERADLVLSGCAILDAICATSPVGWPGRRRPRRARGHPVRLDAAEPAH